MPWSSFRRYLRRSGSLGIILALPPGTHFVAICVGPALLGDSWNPFRLVVETLPPAHPKSIRRHSAADVLRIPKSAHAGNATIAGPNMDQESDLLNFSGFGGGLFEDPKTIYNFTILIEKTNGLC